MSWHVFGHSKFEEDAGVGPTVQENGQLDPMCNPYAQMLYEDLRCIRDLGSAESFDAMWSGSLLQLTEPECLEAFLAVDSRELRARFLAVETPPPGMDCDSPVGAAVLLDDQADEIHDVPVVFKCEKKREG